MNDELQLEAFKLLLVEKLKQADNIVACYTHDGIDSPDRLYDLCDSLVMIKHEVGAIEKSIKFVVDVANLTDDIPFPF